MILFGDSNESAEAFIGDNLSLYQSRWLKIQCEALGESRARLLKAILRELVTGPSRGSFEEIGKRRTRPAGDERLYVASLPRIFAGVSSVNQ